MQAEHADLAALNPCRIASTFPATKYLDIVGNIFAIVKKGDPELTFLLVLQTRDTHNFYGLGKRPITQK